MWLHQRRKCPDPYAEPVVGKTQNRKSGTGSKSATVSVTSPINLFIIVIYRPPGPLGDFLEEMDTLLSVFPSDSTPLTVLGDFHLTSFTLRAFWLF
ncbi:hypothetical protein QTP70_034551 [Hemibagrus guttatus]|uniref:Uncharacterized protein n=1 Tax=Hemibagrus guttatus TaxID=175788 RepID=A0AAE0RCJ8_9TELE|nr:hypothetical protein QTP70_034551 [Hemibagrus guttatus]KAK3570315.1 hypothetical protein QTP86_017173 [Hemibagrus guttatus]